MHHTLRFYGQHQHSFLKLYMSLARLTKVPLAGRLVRRLANAYGRHEHGGYLLTLPEAEQIIDAANNIALGPCSCRHVFHNCDNPIMAEIVLGTGAGAYFQQDTDFRSISKTEAKELLSQTHQNGLVHSIIRCGHHFYAICSCCSCCCVPLRLRQKYGIGSALQRHPDIVQEFVRQQL